MCNANIIIQFFEMTKSATYINLSISDDGEIEVSRVVAGISYDPFNLNELLDVIIQERNGRNELLLILAEGRKINWDLSIQVMRFYDLVSKYASARQADVAAKLRLEFS